MDGGIASDKMGIEEGASFFEFMVHQVDEHVHGPLADFMEVHMEGGKGRTKNIGILGANQRNDFDIFRNL